jgi:hypothetical protein
MDRATATCHARTTATVRATATGRHIMAAIARCAATTDRLIG